MPNVYWPVFATLEEAGAFRDRLSLYCGVVDGDGPNSYWGCVYESPAGAPTMFTVEVNSTLFLPDHVTSKTWPLVIDETNNRGFGFTAAIGDPLMTADDLAKRQTINFDDFVEHV